VSDLEAPRPPRIGLPVVVYVLSLLAGIFIIQAYRPALPVTLLICAVPAAALAWMIVQGIRARRVLGATPCGSRVYARRIFVLALVYAALLMAAVWLNRHYTPTGPVAVLVALLPALPLIGMIVALGRLILDEKDEYQRMLHVRQMLIATGLMLAVCSVWGFLEEFDQVPHLPAYWAFIVWCAGLGFGTLYNERQS
jgi:FtsH-binding integral membrane protein